MTLTSFLQHSFAADAPTGWRSSHEVPLLSKELEKRLGFSPRADVLLENAAQDRRIWVEFEISRADPAANHMKFAVGHLFSPQQPGDAFVSMVSRHVAAGRTNLGATAVMLMRRLGMHAFQIPLFPTINGADIQALNHLPRLQLIDRNLDIGPEIERAITITEPVFTGRTHRLFFASNAFEVSLNVINWNQGVATVDGAGLWGKRTVTYFVYDPRSDLFAPSKFCAFLPMRDGAYPDATTSFGTGIGMTVNYYSSIDQHEPLFDGGAAKRHLLDRLGYQLIEYDTPSGVQARFEQWVAAREQLIRIHPRSAHILVPGQSET